MKPIENRHGVEISELSDKTIKESVKIRNCTDCTIDNLDISGNDEDHLFVLWNCQNCTITGSKFHGRSRGECTVKVDGDCTPGKKETYPMDNTFEGCEWFDLSGGATGGEPLRIGDSRRSHLTYNTTISGCEFRNLTADDETISIKSCGNTIVDCDQINCQSSFVIRQGHTNTIEECRFTGVHGGIRVYGKDNKILGNTFTENQSEKFLPLLLVNGTGPREPNEGAPGTAPASKVYAQVRNAEISGNTFENCVKCVVWGRDASPFKPDGVSFVDNDVIANKVRSVVIEFVNAEPFRDGNKKLTNTFADNTVVGNASIDSRIAQGFEKEIKATQ